MTTKLKRCTVCREEKPKSEYHKDKYRPDGLCQQCKKCRKLAKKKYYQNPENLAKSREYSKRYHRENKETIREYDRKRGQIPEYRKRKQEQAQKRRRTPEHRKKDREAKRELAKNPEYQKKRGEYDRLRRKIQYQKVRAREVVRRAVYRGKIPPASALVCDWPGCQKQANEYHHHKGYEKDHWLDVQPLCYEHHGLVHRDNS